MTQSPEDEGEGLSISFENILVGLALLVFIATVLWLPPLNLSRQQKEALAGSVANAWDKRQELENYQAKVLSQYADFLAIHNPLEVKEEFSKYISNKEQLTNFMVATDKELRVATDEHKERLLVSNKIKEIFAEDKLSKLVKAESSKTLLQAEIDAYTTILEKQRADLVKSFTPTTDKKDEILREAVEKVFFELFNSRVHLDYPSVKQFQKDYETLFKNFFKNYNWVKLVVLDEAMRQWGEYGKDNLVNKYDVVAAVDQLLFQAEPTALRQDDLEDFQKMYRQTMFFNETVPVTISTMSETFNTLFSESQALEERWDQVVENLDKDSLEHKLEQKVVKEVIRSLEELGSLPVLEITEMTKAALSLYDADQIGVPDYACSGLGAQVVESHSAIPLELEALRHFVPPERLLPEPHPLRKAVSRIAAVLGHFRFWTPPEDRAYLDPRVAAYHDTFGKDSDQNIISSSLLPGDCWPFPGTLLHQPPRSSTMPPSLPVTLDVVTRAAGIQSSASLPSCRFRAYGLYLGSEANITIQLAAPVRVTRITIDHVHPKIATSSTTAIRGFSVYAFNDKNEKQEILHDRFPLGVARKTFEVTNPTLNPTSFVTLVIHSNHGASYTCVYRLRVHSAIE